MAPKHSGPPAGLLFVDKPAGVTSNDVVTQVKRHAFFEGCKVGHAGTLDPFATGLLILTVGEATRYQDRVMGLRKGYEAAVQFGATSTTGDTEGEILQIHGAKVDAESLSKVLPSFVGDQIQQVPIYSAVKVDGERLYKKARKGEQVDLPSREVTVHNISMSRFELDQQIAYLDIDCSKGTYIRQLAQDIGKAVGSGGYCAKLRRTSIGPFSLNDSCPLDQIVALGDLSESKCWKPLQVLFGEISL